MNIHSTAFVSPEAELAENVAIGPYCIVGPGARLAAGVVLRSHVVIEGRCELGAGTIVHPFSVLGGAPQHLGYDGAPTQLIIGERNIIREQVTMNLGTVDGGGVTRVGDDGFFMTACHVAHDCQVGDRVIFANSATLGGHVQVGNGVFLGGLCAIHQHSRIGDFAFVGGCAGVTADIIPYASVAGNHANLVGLNVIGLKRRGVEREVLHAIRAAYKLLFADHDTFNERLEKVRLEFGGHAEVKNILDFIDVDASRRLMAPAR